MKTVLRNGLAVIAGIVVGSFVNMGLVLMGPAIVPPPPGVDVGNAQGLAASMHLFEPRHFAVPFVAHALGTLAGAFTAHTVAATAQPVMACVVGVFFLFGGIAASFMIPAPPWFIALDLLVAYLPMAWLATRIRRAAGAPARRLAPTPGGDSPSL